MTLDGNGLIHADATVIAGLLILVSILHTYKPELSESVLKDKTRKERAQILKPEAKWQMVLAFAIGGIIPFSISAIILIFGPMYLAQYVMAAGFGYLITVVVALAIKSSLVYIAKEKKTSSGGQGDSEHHP